MTQLVLSIHTALARQERQKQFATIMAAAAFCAGAVKAMAGFGPISQARPAALRLYAISAATAGFENRLPVGPSSPQKVQ